MYLAIILANFTIIENTYLVTALNIIHLDDIIKCFSCLFKQVTLNR